MRLLIVTIAGHGGAPATVDALMNEVRLPWRRRNEAHPICSPETKRLYLPATRKFATYTTVTPTAVLEQADFDEVSDAQLIEIARVAEASELQPNTDTVDEEKSESSK